MHPDDEVLAALALGEQVPGDVTVHTADCATCSAVLADLRRILQHVRLAADVEFADPPPSVWAAISAATAASPDTATDRAEAVHAAPIETEPGDGGSVGARPADERPVNPGQPHAGQMDTSAMDEVAERRARPRRRPAGRWLIAATAAGVALGVLGVQIVGALRTPPTPVVASAQLDTLTDPRRGGDAKLVEQPAGLALQVNVEPLDPKGGYLEVWLINTDLSRMVSVGVLPANDTAASFVVAPGMVDQGYRIVDISREQFDDRPQHSGDSLLRGTLG